MKRILVALSGGVDSATAAAILKRSGYRVEGAIMVFEGVSQEVVEHAREVSEKLRIPFYSFDFTKEFHDIIVGDFIEEYRRGKTPNPCVLCNKKIKFGLFMQKAEEMGIHEIATGHYACIDRDNERYRLKRGIAENEQSYFLYRLDQRQLSRTVLPLGSYTKAAVRKLAKEEGLRIERHRESQDICFIPDGNYASYLEKSIPQQSGPIYDNEGKVIGRHRGITYYTYGQRRGIGVSHRRPLYVTNIDFPHNAIYVGEKEDVYRSQLVARDIHFIPFDSFTEKMKVLAKSRYVSPLSPAVIEPITKKRAKVTFDEPQWALTPGQSVVFYQGDVLLGGGIIEEIR